MDPKTDNQDPKTEETKTKEVKQPTVSPEELAVLREQVAQLRGALDQANATSQRQLQPQPAEPQIIDVSDEELDAVISEGQKGGAKKIRQAINAAVETRIRAMEKRMNDIEAFGTSALGDLSEKVAASDMPYKKHPVIGKKIEEEVKKVKAMNPALVVNTNILRAIHDRVVGENIDALTQEKIEQASRASREKVGSSLPGSTNGRENNNEDKSKIPTVTELLGEEAQQALDSKGQTADEFARRLGHGNWEGYAKVIQAQRAA